MQNDTKKKSEEIRPVSQVESEIAASEKSLKSIQAEIEAVAAAGDTGGKSVDALSRLMARERLTAGLLKKLRLDLDRSQALAAVQRLEYVQRRIEKNTKFLEERVNAIVPQVRELTGEGEWLTDKFVREGPVCATIYSNLSILWLDEQHAGGEVQRLITAGRMPEDIPGLTESDIDNIRRRGPVPVEVS